MKLLLSIIFGLIISMTAFATNNSLELSYNSEEIHPQTTKYYSYNFGSVLVNWSRYADFYLKNNGRSHLNIHGIYILGNSYWAWSNCPRDLAPGQRCLTRVEFRPWFEGFFTGRLRFALPSDNIIIDLYGWGVRY